MFYDALIFFNWLFLLFPCLWLLSVTAAVVFTIHLQRIPKQDRGISLWGIWLLAIPLWNLFWNFVVFIRISRTFKRWQEQRFQDLKKIRSTRIHAETGTLNYARVEFPEIPESEIYKQNGLDFCIFSVMSLLPCLGVVAFLGAIFKLIFHLVRLSKMVRLYSQ